MDARLYKQRLALWRGGGRKCRAVQCSARCGEANVRTADVPCLCNRFEGIRTKQVFSPPQKRNHSVAKKREADNAAIHHWLLAVGRSD